MKTAFTVIFIVLFCVVNVAIADNIDKAEKLITIERYNAAHNLIEAEIVNDPENANNFYRAGILYLRMGWDTQANECFSFAEKFDKSIPMRNKIAKIYQAKAFIAISQEKTSSAKRFFNHAHKLCPSMRIKDTQDLFSYGKDYLQRGESKKAYSYFSVAYAINPQLGDKISDAYYDICGSIKRPCFAYYRRCQEFSNKNTVKIVTLLTSLYKTKGISQEWKRKIKGEVKRYVSKAEFQQIFKLGWQEICKKTFTGVGFTGGDDGKGGVTILTNGKNVHYGDRVTILGEHAQGWIAMKYKPTINGKVSFINRARINGDIGARAPKGEQFTVIVEHYQK